MAELHYFEAVGRRKCAIARVRLYPGGGAFVVNGKPMEEVFNRPAHQGVILSGLRTTGNAGKFSVQVKVVGGGITGWAGAISHGIARALVVVPWALPSVSPPG